MLKLHFLIGLLYLTGCVSSQVEQARTPWQFLKQQSRQCFLDLKNDSELKSIMHKVTLDTDYDRDAYFELANIKVFPTPEEQIAIKKWASKLNLCYRIKADSYAYEPAGVAKWSLVKDGEQLTWVREFSRGRVSYGEFAVRRLEIDTRYRGDITRAVSADYKHPEYPQQKNGNAIHNMPPDSSSACGWEGTQWVCRSL